MACGYGDGVAKYVGTIATFEEGIGFMDFQMVGDCGPGDVVLLVHLDGLAWGIRIFGG